MKYIATFYTHSGALKYQRHLQSADIVIELRPVPRQLSSSCGLAGEFFFSGEINSMISEDIEKLYQVTEQGYVLLYTNE